MMNKDSKIEILKTAKFRVKTLWTAYFLHNHDMNTQARIRELIDNEYKFIREIHQVGVRKSR